MNSSDKSPTQVPIAFEFGATQSFDHFIPGENEILLDQLKKVCRNQSDEAQLITISGKTGLGKSHLLQATCQFAKTNGLSMFYLPMREVRNLSPNILEGLESLDIVCIDDIDLIAGDALWEEQIFHLFNRLWDNRRTIVISSGRPLSDSGWPTLADLRSRLQWGISYQLQPLNDNDKLTALLQQASHSGIELEPRVARYILTHENRDPGQLWQRLEQLNQASLSQKRKLTVPFLKQFLTDSD